MKVSEILFFQDMVFHGGLNLTCRKGLKWAFLNPRDRIDVAETGRPEEIIGEALVHAVFVGPFWMLPAELVKREHYPPARDKAVLFREMHKIYGEFEQLDLVTAITFEPLWETRGRDA